MILLVDMDAFYASVHLAEDKTLLGKPVLIGGDPKERRGVVTTASYEARAKGVKPPMPLWRALKLCPDSIVIRPDFTLYKRYSAQVIEILLNYSPLVEQASIDEAYVDVEGSFALFGDPTTIAGSIKADIRRCLNLPCSVGIGDNKLLAKMAAEIGKPDGLLVLTKQQVPEIMWPLPVRELYGVGPKTGEKLGTMGVKTIGDLAQISDNTAKGVLGKYGLALRDAARGEGSTHVDPEPKEPKSIGHQNTLARDAYSAEEVRGLLGQQAQDICRSLRRREMGCTVVRVGIKDKNFHYFTRQCTLWEPTSDPSVMLRSGMALLEACFPPAGIRMVGLTAAGLVKKKPDIIGSLLDAVEEKYGRGKLSLGLDPGSGDSSHDAGESGDS